MKRRIRTFVLLSALTAGALVPGAAQALNARMATELYLDIRDTERVPAGWTGDVGSCQAGTESKPSIEATLFAVNGMRRFAGLRPVRFDAALNRKALEAALMMRAANANSHTPGPEWPCYTKDGAEAAGTSNLFQGESGAGAMVGYVDDLGVPSLGHRRWVLDPRGVRWGTGSTGSTNALLVAGASSRSNSAPVPAIVAWPPAGTVPWPLVFEDWSASFAARDTDLSSATVAVEVDGESRPVTGVTDLGPGAGEGTALAWRVGLQPSDRAGDRRVSVKIAYGNAKTASYVVDTVSVLPPLAPSVSTKRGRKELKISWKGARERGVPITGFRIKGYAGEGYPGIKRRVGPKVRSVTVPDRTPDRYITLRVFAMSRLGAVSSQVIDVAP